MIINKESGAQYEIIVEDEKITKFLKLKNPTEWKDEDDLAYKIEKDICEITKDLKVYK